MRFRITGREETGQVRVMELNAQTEESARMLANIERLTVLEIERIPELLDTTRVADRDGTRDPSIQPELWNPNAAINWSLLFSPAFGAYLHAANWRTLGNPGMAKANMAWVWIQALFLAINLGTLFLPASQILYRTLQIAALAILLGWYFTQGENHAQFVKSTFGDSYLKRGWGQPLLFAISIWAAYLIVVFFLYFAARLTG